MEGHGDGLDFSALGHHLSQQQQDTSLGFCPGTHFPQQINPALDSANVFPSILAVAGGCPPSSLYPSISTPHNILVEPLQGAGGVLPWAAPTQTLFTALLSIQQRTHQIQALVQLMMGVGVGVGVGGIGGGGGHSQFAPSIASLISELVVTATGMLQQFSVSLPQVIAGDLHLHSPSLSLPFAEQGFFPAAELLRMGNYSSSSSSPFFNGPNLGSTSCSFPDDGLDDPSAGLLNVGNPSRVNGGRRKGEGYGNRDTNGDGDHGLGDGHRDGDHVLGDRNGDGDQALGDGIGDGNHGFGDGDRRWDPESDEEEEAAGSYELIEMAEFEILAEHTHFCSVCGKGFKRDANLRMHMRGHGDEYKTPAALARPAPPPPPPGPVPLEGSSTGRPQLRPRRYSCPSDGCKRNKRHRKFRPLKTLLCVKNHYRRSHCPKVLICAKCGNKRFSVLADLKTHEKHCGRDKWQCSCGTTFSRKDKLFGHVSLFSAGHFPDPSIPTNTTTTITTTIHPPLSPPPTLNPSFPIPNAAPSTFHDFPPALFHHNNNPFRPKLLSHCDELTPDLFVHHPK